MYRKFCNYCLFGFVLFLVVSCQTKPGLFLDGVYEGSSRGDYTSEPYWGNVKITIKNGYIADVAFQVVDSSKNEVFGENYLRHFAGNKVYQEQCRNDWNGIKNYPKELIIRNNIDSVDAITGATWSYNILAAAVKKALKNARR